MRTLTIGDGQDLLDAYKRAWERRDVDLAVSLFSEDAEYRPDPFEEPHRGANAIRAMWNDISANEVHVEFDAERIWVSGRTVLANYHAAYTDRGNSDRVRVRGFLTFEVDDRGKVWRAREWPVSQVVGKDQTWTPLGEGQRAG